MHHFSKQCYICLNYLMFLWSEASIKIWKLQSIYIITRPSHFGLDGQLTSCVVFHAQFQKIILWAICVQGPRHRLGKDLHSRGLYVYCELMKYMRNDVGDLPIGHSSGGMFVTFLLAANTLMYCAHATRPSVVLVAVPGPLGRGQQDSRRLLDPASLQASGTAVWGDPPTATRRQPRPHPRSWGPPGEDQPWLDTTRTKEGRRRNSCPSMDSFLLERGRRGRARFFSLSRQQQRVSCGWWLPAADALRLEESRIG